jgi:hypothetical protein
MSQLISAQPEGDDVLSYERRKYFNFRGLSGGATIAAGAVVFISDSFVNYAARTNTLITAPLGIQDGDDLLIIFEDGALNAAPVPIPPAGFNIVTGFPLTRADSNNFTVDTYAWRKTASGEAGDYTVTHANATSNAWMQCARGQNLITPYDPNPTTNTGLGDTATAPGLTTAVDNSLIVYFCSKWNFPGGTFPGGVTPVLTTRLDGSATLLFVSNGVLTPPGATGAKVATGLPNTPTEPWATGLIAIRP